MLKVPSLALPTGIPALLQLFEGPLAEVQFPDVDRASLSALSEQAVVAGDALGRARAALVEAQAALGEAETAVVASEASLVAKAQRALAYARVFAEGNAELMQALGAIELGGATPAAGRASKTRDSATPSTDAAPPRRRGRPKPARSDDERAASDLFVVPAVTEAVEREVAAAS